MENSDYDIIIFGATGFVGQLTAEALAQQLSADSNLRWAIAGRSAAKLNALRDSLNQHYPIAPDVVVADSFDLDALLKLCATTSVVASTVGPYALYGENLVHACVETGTDYCDLTGEAHWVVQMISRYQERAAISGARIVHSCGFDCIPSDLGVHFVQQYAQDTYSQPCDEIAMRVSKMRGKFSGGTYASLLNLVKEINETPGLRKAIASPYCFCPSDHPFTVQQVKHRGAAYDAISDAWIAPFVMEGINTRTVHRSNVLLDYTYGESFRYEEAVIAGKGRKGRKRATRLSWGLGLLMMCASVPMLSAMLSRWFLPKPGQGPNRHERDTGEYELIFFGKVRGKGKVRARVTGAQDPGYGSTSKMLAQAALCLSCDVPKHTKNGGFWTPASIFGDTLIARLQEKADMRFVIETDD